jgi:ribosomal-protein-alanine N-acetyltransferase
MRSQTSPALRIVDVSSADAELLAAIHATGFHAPWSADDFALFLRQPGMMAWAAGVEDATGFILVRHVADEAEVVTIAVTPATRQHGIGRALVAHALDVLRARGVATVYLEVATNNVAAIALYRRVGFKASATRRNYYKESPDPAARDATLMRCDL